MFLFKREISERCPRFFSAFVSFFKGDACTSCQSLGAVLGDGIAVPGPKGERGDPGPPGEGKNGKNVRKSRVCSYVHLFFCAMHKKKMTILFSFQGKPGLAGVQGPVGPKGSKVRFYPPPHLL